MEEWQPEEEHTKMYSQFSEVRFSSVAFPTTLSAPETQLKLAVHHIPTASSKAFC